MMQLDQANLICPQLEVSAAWLFAHPEFLVRWTGFLKPPGPNLSLPLPGANSSGLMQSRAFQWMPALVFLN